MQKTLNKYLACISMMALSFSLYAGVAYAGTCGPFPTCDQMGYNQTSCNSNFEAIKCPFNPQKMVCMPKASICASLGYISTSCSGADTILKCPLDPTKLACIYSNTNYVEMNECQNGDAVYAYTPTIGSYNYTKVMCGDRITNNTDMSSSNYYMLGIVVDSANHIAVSTLGSSFGSLNPAGRAYWDTENRDFTGVTNIASEANARNDTAGYAHSQAIYNALGYSNVIQNVASSCYTMNNDGPPRARKYYLPAAGEIIKLSSIKSAIDKVDPRVNQDRLYWSSTPSSTEGAWMFVLDEGTLNNVPKDMGAAYNLPGEYFHTVCFFEYY